MKSKSFLQKYSVVIYFVLAYAIAWVGSFWAIGPQFLAGAPIGMAEVYLVAAAMLLAPSLTGISLTYLVDGRAGLHNLWVRMGRWRVGGRWYAALLIFPFLILVVQWVLSRQISPAFTPYFFVEGIVIGLIVGFLEEMGWTGYALPKIRQRYSAVAASLLIGVLHVVWHLGADYLSAAGMRGVYWLPRFFFFCVAMIPMRIILNWIYENTESLLLAQLMHASSSGFLSVLVPLTLSPAEDMLFYAVYAVPLWLVAIYLIARFGGNLRSREHSTDESRINEQRNNQLRGFSH